MAAASPIRGLLLASAGRRLAVAGVAVVGLWAAVIGAIVTNRPAPSEGRQVAPLPPVLRLVVASGQASPSGGNFDRFDVGSQPIVAPVNARGHVAFYASVVRVKAREGIFLS